MTPDPKRYRWWTHPLALIRRILTLDDTPHSIAMGVTVGMFIGLTPTVGIQMLIVVVVAALTARVFQFNRLAALLTVYVSNPITTVPIYYFNYKIGTLFVGGDLTRGDFERILRYDGLAKWWGAVLELIVEVGTPLLIGSLLVATICAAVSYPAMRLAVQAVRRRSGEDGDRGSSPSTGRSGSAAA